MADFVDAFVIGDGEEAVGEIADVVGAWKRGGRPAREAVLRELATIPGVYVPSMYDVDYDGPVIADGHAAYRRRPRGGRQAHGRRPRRVAVPEEQLVPLDRGRARPAQRRDLPGLHARLPLLPGGHDHPPGAGAAGGAGAHDGRRGSARTGYDEVALTSLSSADFSGIDGVVADLVNDQDGHRQGQRVAAVACASTRSRVGIATEIQKVRRTGLTFAPEAGSWRLRQVINKLILEEDLYAAVDAAYSQGWRRVKLYFLTGLPTEMDDDTLGIAELAKNVVEDRAHVHEAGELHGLGRRVRAQAAHAVPVVRPEQRRGAGSQDQHAARRRRKGTKAQVQVARPERDVRRRASSAAATAASGG